MGDFELNVEEVEMQREEMVDTLPHNYQSVSPAATFFFHFFLKILTPIIISIIFLKITILKIIYYTEIKYRKQRRGGRYRIANITMDNFTSRKIINNFLSYS